MINQIEIKQPEPKPGKTQARTNLFLRAGALGTLFGNTKARIGFAIVMFFVMAALLAPIIAPGNPKKYVGKPNQPPSAEFWLGTNPQGKDVYQQLVWGGRLSLVIGFGSAIGMLFISTTIGMIAGYNRGIKDDLLNFLMNLFLVIPGLPLLMLLSAYLKPSTATMIVALAITGWAYNGRIIRAQTMSIREKDFVAAAVVSGEPTLECDLCPHYAEHGQYYCWRFYRRSDLRYHGLDGSGVPRPGQHPGCHLGHQPVLGAERRRVDDWRLVGFCAIRFGSRPGSFWAGLNQLWHG